MKTKINWVQLTRHLVQILGLIVLPGAFIMLFNSFKSVYHALLSGTFTLEGQGSALLWIGIVIPATMIWGRFFCGWLCAFGAMQELLAFIARKLKIPQLRINEDLDRVLRRMKYVVLAVLVIFWTLKISIDAFSPWFVFGQYSSVSGWTTFSHLLTFGGVLLFLIIIGSLFSERVFCKYFCPLGGILHVSSKLRLFKIKKRRRLCVDCTRCSKVCPMEIEVDQETSDAKSGAFSECINCFRCSAACPKAALYYNSKEALAGTMAALTMTGVFYGGNLLTSKAQASSQTASVQTSPVLEERTDAQLPSGVTQTESQKADGSSDSQVVADSQKPIETSSVTGETIEETTDGSVSQGQTASEGRYADGTYYGTGSGFRGSIEVSVTVESGFITDITIESYKDDRQFFSRAKESVIDAIISAQDTDVSAVSGATYSSRGIMEAVADALDQSWMEKAAETTLEAEETEESEEESEEDLTWEAEEEPEESEEEEFSEEDEEEEETEESEDEENEEQEEETEEDEESEEDREETFEDEDEEEPESVGESTGYFADGYYQGSGSGRNGAIVVSVTVEGGYITSIDVESSSEDSPYFSRAVYVIDEVLSAQSVDVATVSGATMSSNGILEAVANALGLDFTNTNSSIGGHGRH
ncbi:MAG: FMN-binding protein [Firmicutes bacterium]|nr:FMN-binding protein [Bacillota bacterium]